MHDLWAWFVEVAPRLADGFDEPLYMELDRRVTALGPFVWELGPGLVRPRSLTISPNVDRDRLPDTIAIINRAPEIPGWELHPAKPPKQWSRPHCVVKENDGRDLQVEAEAWRCALLRHEDGAHELLVLTPNLAGAPIAVRDRAVEIIVQGLVGEMLRMERLAHVTAVDAFDEREERRAFPISELEARLRGGRR